MTLRKSTIFASLTLVNVLLIILIAAHADYREKHSNHAREINRALVRDLGLTDLCLFTEARYTRHPSMADRHAAFQEHPSALDHFPSGSLLLPVKPPVRTHAEIH